MSIVVEAASRSACGSGRKNGPNRICNYDITLGLGL